eukprot:GFUD01080100.1.p1 GENE.GFUD01080100.1~~GFUD01080100.1.p1  ORF type:complete len:165 (-),score=56.29 GFUD01080100.1:38-484(-)
MWDLLLLPFKQISCSQSSSSSTTFTHSTSSSRRSSLYSSRPEFRPIHSEIIRRNLITDFLEATSLPVNVPIHRSREASQPSTPMREEFDWCAKQLPFSLASKLFSVPSLADQMEEDMSRGVVEDSASKTSAKEKKNEYMDDLMFQIDL